MHYYERIPKYMKDSMESRNMSGNYKIFSFEGEIYAVDCFKWGGQLKRNLGNGQYRPVVEEIKQDLLDKAVFYWNIYVNQQKDRNHE